MDASSKDALRTVWREPVAWRWRRKDAEYWMLQIEMPAGENISAYEIEPLYAAPSPDTAPGTGAEGMREALQELLDWIERYPPDFLNDEKWPDVEERARAALSRPAPGQDVPEPRPDTATATVGVAAYDIKAWRSEWLEANDPQDGTDCVTPFDHYLYLSEPRPAGGEAVLREAATSLLADLDRTLQFSDHRIVAATNASVKRLRSALALADRAEPGGREEE